MGRQGKVVEWVDFFSKKGGVVKGWRGPRNEPVQLRMGVRRDGRDLKVGLQLRRPWVDRGLPLHVDPLHPRKRPVRVQDHRVRERGHGR